MSPIDQDKRQPPSESVAREAERWLARLRSPNCRASDREHFQEWLARHPKHWHAYNNAEHVWAAAAQAKDPELDALADRILGRARQRRQNAPQRVRLLGWAAAIVVMVTGAVGAFKSDWLAPDPPATTYSTAIGEIRSFTLADNSVVTLNTDTVLQARMGSGAREIFLQRGEAQFKVTHDPKRPFTVSTAQASTTAIGTLFQVRNTNAATEVSLLEGRVRVAPAKDVGTSGPVQELAPGDRLIAKTGAPWIRGSADLDVANGWISGRLVFESIPLRKAVEEFNRYSQRKLRIDDSGIGDIPIEGIFNAGDSESIALALQYAYPLRVENRGQEIVLRRK